MPLPTLIKTWEFRTNLVSPATGVNEDTSARRHSVSIKNALTDTIAHLYAGTAAIQLVAGTTFRINPNPGSANTVFDPAIVGTLTTKTMRLRGMTTGANNGDFSISAHQDLGGGEWVLDFTIPSGGNAENIIGSVNVLSGAFTIPWEMDFCNTPGDGLGTPGDEVDRIVDWGDMTSGTGNVSSWVIKNPVTGTRWCMSGDVSSTSYIGTRMVLIQTVAPSTFTPGALTSYPRGTLDALGTEIHTVYSNNADAWFWDTTTDYNMKIHVMMSDDGEQTRLMASAFGLSPLFWIDGVVDNPHPEWAAGAVTPVVACMMRSQANNVATYGNFNDTANLRASAIPWPLTTLSRNGEDVSYLHNIYATSEGYIDGANGQKWGGANELSGEYPLYPWGLACFDVGMKGRMGELPDIWWSGTDLVNGHSFPDDNSRQFMVWADIVTPWDGSFIEFG
jgi:hypothetical protein